MLRRLASSLGLAALGATSIAVPLNYAQRSVPVRAGVVLIDSAHLSGNAQPANFSPYVLFNLDTNAAVKPAGWNIYNPHAISTVTSEVFSRWTLIHAAIGGTKPVPAVGTALTKRDGAYWEVRLSKSSDAQLGDYDLLVLPAHGNISLNPQERERLRRFVDQGGVLWVDLTAAAEVNANGSTFEGDLSGVNGLPIPFGLTNTNGPSGTGADYLHPLLSYPNGMTAANLGVMQADTVFGLKAVDLADAGATGLESMLQPLTPDFNRFKAIAWDARGPFMMVGRLGDGAVVLTSRGVASMLNTGVDGNGNLLPNLQARAEEPASTRGSWAAAKLLVNMIALTNSYAKSGQGSRGKNSLALDAGAPMLKQFMAPGSFVGASNFNYVTPALYKGLLVVVSNDRVFVYDAKPSTDLDGDGDPDDGVQDLSLGDSYDLLWSSESLGGPISPPTCAEIPAGDVIMVQCENGDVAEFEAFNYDADRRIATGADAVDVGPMHRVSPPNGQSGVDGSAAGRGPYSPTFHEGLVYVADTQNSTIGRIWVFNPADGTLISSAGGDWVVGSPTSPVITPVGGSPLVGYIPIQDNSGGQDRVAYVPTRPVSGSSGANGNAGLTSVWIGARGEKPVRTEIVGADTLQITTRASQKGLSIHLPTNPSSLGIKLTMLKLNGDPFTASEMVTAFTGDVTQPSPGVLRFRVNNTSLVDPTVVSPRLDYTIDWGVPGASNAAVRGNVFFPDDFRKSRRLLNGLAMSATGMIYAVTSHQQSTVDLGSDQKGGGSLFALREEGQGTFRLVYRYDLYPGHDFTVNQTETVHYGPTFLDKDPLNISWAPALSGEFKDLVFEGGPSVHNGMVYVTARGTKTVAGFDIDYFTILMCFRAEPEAVEIKVPRIEGGFSIVQPDMLRSGDLAKPDVYSTLQSGQFRYEHTGDGKGIVRIDSLMASNRGPIQNSLSTSQPVIIRRTGQPDTVIEPDRLGSRWSPLLHYMVLSGMKNQSPPIVTGDTVYVIGTSLLGSLVTTGTPFGTPPALIYGVDADVSPSDSFLKSDSDRPWMNQYMQIGPNTDELANPGLRWPQTRGADSFASWVTRVQQALLTDTSDAPGIVAGEGNLVAWTSSGVWGFRKADFVICDEGRLAKFDSSGNPIWTTDATLNAGGSVDTVAAMNVKPLVRPTRAYPAGLTDLWVVDSGADRCVKIDVAGKELRSIEAFILDPAYRPEGYEVGESTSLRGPRDILVYTTYMSNPTDMTAPQPLEYWVHYVIADAGNHRIVELIDRYAVDPATRAVTGVVTYPDPNNPSLTVSALGVLWWHTPAAFSGKSFEYNSVARTWVPDGAGGGEYVFAAGVGGALPTRVDTGLDRPGADPAALREERSGNNGIVVFQGANSEVINEVVVPAIGDDLLWDPTANSGAGGFNLPAVASHRKKLSNLTSVTMQNTRLATGETRAAIMFTDNSGVYEIVKNGTDWEVVWMMPRIVYQVLRRNPSTGVPTARNPVGFRPTYARRLSSGEVLIVNGYYGRYRVTGNEFAGEVIQVDGSIDFTAVNLGFNSLSVRFELPTTQGARGIVLPVFADRR